MFFSLINPSSLELWTPQTPAGDFAPCTPPLSPHIWRIPQIPAGGTAFPQHPSHSWVRLTYINFYWPPVLRLERGRFEEKVVMVLGSSLSAGVFAGAVN